MEKMPITVVLDKVRSTQNAGALFRTGDAFAVEQIFCAASPPLRSAVTSTKRLWGQDDRCCGAVCPRREGVRFPQRERTVLIRHAVKQKAAPEGGAAFFRRIWFLSPDNYIVRVGRVTVGGRLVERIETLVRNLLDGSLAIARRTAVGPDQFAAKGDVPVRASFPCGVLRGVAERTRSDLIAGLERDVDPLVVAEPLHRECFYPRGLRSRTFVV